MISFRFHLVSLVAVFLALGLGILSGTAVLNRGIVAQLESQTNTLARDSDALRAQLDEAQAALDGWARFGEDLVPHLVSGRLDQREIVVLTEEGTDEAALASVQTVLEQAGARILTLLEVSDRMAMTTEADQAALGEVVGSEPVGDPDQLASEAARELADQLAFGPSASDVLSGLIDEGFISNLGRALGESQMRELSDTDAVVVVAGGPEPPQPAPELFLVPFVGAAVDSGIPVAAAESEESAFDFVTVLRGDEVIADDIVTQDNVDETPGGFGLVLALDDLLVSGRGGHYGVKDGSAGVIPPPSP